MVSISTFLRSIAKIVLIWAKQEPREKSSRAAFDCIGLVSKITDSCARMINKER